ncbi:MAG: metal-dependent transcriptional regulator [Ignavibacteriaceae bacterium]|nr:metal-dependent transcriptional regulator [Ignavibacteriaceae bacterium]
MTEPVITLLIGTGIILLGIVSFLPEKGLVARMRRTKTISKRVLIEDALKHLYNCEYNSVSCTLDSVAGKLSISEDEAAELITKLEDMGLLISHHETLQLSSEGRSYALRIIRIHRLWEKYLADETGVDERDWHHSAEEFEHKLTASDADILAAQIGNPVFDPHGDPIPSTEGILPDKTGKPMTDLKFGEFANIIHIEDEPDSIYQQLVAEGLYPGMQVRMMESNKERIRFTANGEECVLAPLFAKNITVEPIKFEKVVEGKFKNLSSLKIGERGRVLGISKALRGQQRRRLMDLGVVPGTDIVAEIKGAFGDPTAYRIKGASIALRKKLAERIYLVPESEGMN